MSQAPRDTRSAAEKARDTASIIGRLKHEGAERFSIGEGGTIAAWAQNSGSAAVTAFDDGVVNGPEHAVYKGLALGNVSGANYLYATDLHNNKVDVFDTNFAKPAATQGKFVDPGMPAGFVPFGITAVKGQLFVTFAMQDAAKHDEMTGAGLGISIFLKPAAILSVDLPPPRTSAGRQLLRRSHQRLHAERKITGCLQRPPDERGGPSARVFRTLVAGNGDPDKPATTLFYTAGCASQTDGVFGSITASVITVTTGY